MHDEYDEIDLRELIHLLLAGWKWMVLFVLVAVFLSGYVTTRMIEPVYEAKSTLFIGKESDSIAGISLSDLQIDNQLVVDYQELIKTRLVTQEVIDDLGLQTSVDNLVERLSVSGIKDSRFIHISFRDTNPELATKITNALSLSLVQHAEDIVGAENVVIVDSAILPLHPVEPNIYMNVAIAGILGLMLAIFLIFGLHMLDNTLKREEDVENLLGIPVLGVVPRFAEDKRTEK